MTKEEIKMEIKNCNAEIRKLIEDNMHESNFDVCMKNYNKMVELAERIGELDTMNKNRLLCEFKERADELVSKFKQKLGIS